MVYNNLRIQSAVYNTETKEEANMKNRIIALALVIVMLFALSACGKKQEPTHPRADRDARAHCRADARTHPGAHARAHAGAHPRRD